VTTHESGVPALLQVHHPDAGTRMRGVNALVITYGMIAAGVVGAVPLSQIPNGRQIAMIVGAATLLFVVAAILLRTGRVSAGLVVFFGGFLAAFAAVPIIGQDARLSAVYCSLPVVVAGVTLHRRGVAVVTSLSLLIAVLGTLRFPPVDPPPAAFEIITAAVLLILIDLVVALLGMWGQRQETRRADASARVALELAESLRVANAELEDRVQQRTDDLQRALSQQERLVGELAELSMRDPLTGLHNRRHAEHELPRMTATADRYRQPLSMALVDLDHFKLVNDRFSYAVGDEVLLRFTAILRENARGSDVVVRYGGEEFLLVMPQTTLEQALVLCERLRSAVESYAWSEVQPTLRLTTSIGVADNHQRDLRGVTAAMDAALHSAKRDGRNRVVAAPASGSVLAQTDNGTSLDSGVAVERD
jgi:diguanylate cyclase (GGDEF)-like protein